MRDEGEAGNRGLWSADHMKMEAFYVHPYNHLTKYAELEWMSHFSDTETEPKIGNTLSKNIPLVRDSSGLEASPPDSWSSHFSMD